MAVDIQTTTSEPTTSPCSAEPVPVRVTLREKKSDEQLAQARELSEQVGISLVAARILMSRGVETTEAAKNFLSPSLRAQLPNPAGIKNLEAAVDLLLDTTEAGEQITVYCDFDVDGLSSGSQLLLYLRALGARVNGYAPSRFVEGYGLVASAVEKLAASGTKLLVTVDCGIGSHKECALAKRLGLKTIIIDHHLPQGIPPADVVVDPAQEGCPFGEHKLAAAGLVWMTLIVLRIKARDRWSEKITNGELEIPDPKSFLDLAALGTICDMVPLTGLNRVIAARGVEAIRETTRPGLVALKKVANMDGLRRFGAGHVAFGLGPRINAAGRLADANEVLHLLTTDDSLKAKSVAEAIDRLNDKRKGVEDLVRSACQQILRRDEQLRSQPAIALYGEDFHPGVIGIVAQRLVEEFHRPAAVMGPGEAMIGRERKPVVKGSVRSIRGFHVADALQSLSSLLVTHGGHAEAGGFTVTFENLEAFQLAFIEHAGKVLPPESLQRERWADIEVEFPEITFDLANELERFSPFGVGNPAPMLISRNVNIESVSSIGNKHLRFRASQGSTHLSGVAWSMQGHPLLRRGIRANILYQVEINSYQGVSSVQLSLKEVW